MFVSAGYFRGITCPYFASGLCERPYCHFRHIAQEKPAPPKRPSVSGVTPTVSGSGGECTTALPGGKNTASQDKVSVPVATSSSYTPTPIANSAEKRNKYAPTKPVKAPGAAQYKPTPIKLLKSQNAVYTPEKQKYLKNALPQPVSDLEYDPSSNYSTTTSPNGDAKKRHRSHKKEAFLYGDDSENELVIEAEFSDEEDVEEFKKKERDKAERTAVKLSKSSKETKKSEKGTANGQHTHTKGVKDYNLKEKHKTKDVPLKEKSTSKSDRTVASDKDKSAKHSSTHKHSNEKHRSSSRSSHSGTSSKTNGKSESHKSSHSSSNSHKHSSSHSSSSKSQKHSHQNDKHKISRSHSSSSSSTKTKDNYDRHKEKSSESNSHKNHNSSRKDSSSSKHRSGSSVTKKRRSSVELELLGNDKSSKSHTDVNRKHNGSGSNSSKHSAQAKERVRRPSVNVDLFGEDSDDEAGADFIEVHSSAEDGANYDLDFDMSIALDPTLAPEEELPVISDSESESDHDTYEECLKIFQEETKTRKSKPKIILKKEEEDPEEEAVVGKKRVAHAALTGEALAKRAKMAPKRLRHRPSPAQVMHARLQQLQKRQLEEQKAEAALKAARAARASALEALSPTKSTPPASALSPTTVLPPGRRLARAPSSDILGGSSSILGGSSSSNKKRIAHVSTWKDPPAGVKSPVEKEAPTYVGTQAKSGQRVAHVPSKSVLKRPTIPTEYGSKVPTSIRQRYLNVFIDECQKFYVEEVDAFERALAEEKTVYGRSGTRNVYVNGAVNTVKRLRHEAATSEKQQGKNSPASRTTVSHAAVLGGSRAAKTSFTVNRSGAAQKQEVAYTGATLYKALQPYVLNEEQLADNGFPRPSDVHGSALIKKETPKKKTNSSNPNERICLRCGIRYTVFPDGTYAKREECVYHWGKAWKKRIAGAIEMRHTCCQGDFDATGCEVSQFHVNDDNRYVNLSGYMKTIPCSPPLNGDYGVYALDCEMVYTSEGSELARVTVIDSDFQMVIDKIVKPEREILDYNTRFSGLTAEDLVGVTTTLRDVQAILLSLFSDKTILVGHSLESDAMALKLIHSTVVDTSVMFPHKMGPPYKRALRTLMAEFMKRIIQNDVGGHDSSEDAKSCMELIIWKLKEDSKKKRR